MPADLNILRDKPLAAIQALPSGGRAWEQGMRQAIAQGHTAAFLAAIKDRTGVMPKGLSRAERTTLKARIERQLKYFDGFVRDVAAGVLSDAQRRARAALYAGPPRGTYFQRLFPGLPFYPTEGSECKANCRCAWVPRGGAYYWELGVAEHCPTCESRAAANPYHIDQEAPPGTEEEEA